MSNPEVTDSLTAARAVAGAAEQSSQWQAEVLYTSAREESEGGIERIRLVAGHRAAAINLQRLGTLGLPWDNGWTLTPA